MINALTIAYEHYLGIPFESFTDKFISALGLIKMIDDVKQEDELILNNLESNTDTEICVSIYILDRTVNPTKGEFKTVSNKIRFEFDGEYKTYTENDIQLHLCFAIRQTHQIIMSYMKHYKLERTMGQNKETEIKLRPGAFDV